MPTPKEAAAIAAIFAAANRLSNDYAKAGGAANRSDQMIAFTDAIFPALAAMADEYGAEAAYIDREAYGVREAITVAFCDVVEAEEEAEPRINPRQYSTLRVVGGSVA